MYKRGSKCDHIYTYVPIHTDTCTSVFYGRIIHVCAHSCLLYILHGVSNVYVRYTDTYIDVSIYIHTHSIRTYMWKPTECDYSDNLACVLRLVNATYLSEEFALRGRDRTCITSMYRHIYGSIKHAYICTYIQHIWSGTRISAKSYKIDTLNDTWINKYNADINYYLYDCPWRYKILVYI